MSRTNVLELDARPINLPAFPSFWSTHQTVLPNLLLLPSHLFLAISLSVPSQVVYCKLKWIIQTAGFHFVLYISRFFPPSLLLHSDIAVWRKRISDGCNDNPERFPFECGPSKFLKNQQRLIGRVYDTPCQLEPPSNHPRNFFFIMWIEKWLGIHFSMR